MTKNKYLLYATVGAVTLATAGIIMVSTVSAATNTGNNLMSDLVSAIAQKFNLNASDVQKVFDDQRAQMHNQMEQKYTDMINKAVTQGKLTQDQASKILAKKADLETQREAFRANMEGKTKAERQAEMKVQKDSLDQWAKDNNIPVNYLMMFGGPKGPKGGYGFGHKEKEIDQ
jgi:predicted phage gp36 major capsid-like protein